MLMSMLLALATAAPVDCPPAGTAARDRMKLAGEICSDEPAPSPVPKAKPQAPFKERPLTASEKAQIIAAADKLLFDGVSARWQWGPRKDASTYCGFVNAKNRMGAYTGWTPFYFFDGKIGIISAGESTIVYDAICSTSGYIEKPEWLSKEG